MSTENFLFLGPRKWSSFGKDGIIFEKIVNLSKNFQKLFFKQLMLNEHETYPFEMRDLGSEAMENCPWVEGSGRQCKVAPSLNGGS